MGVNTIRASLIPLVQIQKRGMAMAAEHVNPNSGRKAKKEGDVSTLRFLVGPYADDRLATYSPHLRVIWSKRYLIAISG